MTDSETDRLSSLLNFATPYAPVDERDATARLASRLPAPTPLSPPPPVKAFEKVEEVKEVEEPPPGLVELLRASARVKQDAPDVRGRDASGRVEVFITTDGVPTEVRLAPQWRSKLGLAGLGGAVLEACAAAEDTAHIARLARLVDGPDAPVELPKSPRRPRLSEAGTDRAGIYRVYCEMLEDLTEKLDGHEAELQARAHDNVQVSRLNGVLTATVAAGTVHDLKIAEKWLRETGDATVGRELAALLREICAARSFALPDSAGKIIGEMQEMLDLLKEA